MVTVKMPIACLLIITYSFICYLKKKKLATFPTMIFKIMTITGMINLVADAVTEYTVNNRDKVSELFNYCWHIVFIVSILSVTFLVYYYFLPYIEHGTGIERGAEKKVSLAVWIITSVIIVVSPIEYVDSPYGSYSLGPKVYALYFGMCYVLLILLHHLVKYHRYIDKTRREVMTSSIIIFTIFSFAQIIFPYILSTGLALSLVIMGIMLTIEDTYQYVNHKTQLYNEAGCIKIIEDLLYIKKPLTISTIYFSSRNREVNDIIEECASFLRTKSDISCGVVLDNMLVIMPQYSIRKMKHYDKNEILDYFSDDEDVEILTDDLEVKAGTAAEEIFKELKEIRKKYSKMEVSRDETTGLLLKKTFVNRINTFVQVKIPFALVLLDLENFNKVNERYGYAVGNGTIREVVRAFKGNLRNNDIVCRMSSDEFAVLLMGQEDPENIMDVINRILNSISQIPNMLSLTVELGASAGIKIYDGSDENTDFDKLYDEADRALYEAKYQGKGKFIFV